MIWLIIAAPTSEVYRYYFCSTILVCVSVVSSLGFGTIWPWKISASFLSALIVSVPKVASREAGAGFLVR